jgi:hypothetical protein
MQINLHIFTEIAISKSDLHIITIEKSQDDLKRDSVYPQNEEIKAGMSYQ